MTRERHVMRKGAKIVATRKHARWNQRRRQNRLCIPRLTEVFEDSIEIAKEPKRETLERDLSRAEFVNADNLLLPAKDGVSHLLGAEQYLALQRPKAPLHPLRERLCLRDKPLTALGRRVEFKA